MKEFIICKDYEGLKKGSIYKIDVQYDFSYVKNNENEEENKIIIPTNILYKIAMSLGCTDFTFYRYEKREKMFKKMKPEYIRNERKIEYKDYMPITLELRNDIQLYIVYPIYRLNESYDLMWRDNSFQADEKRIEAYFRIQDIVNKIIDETIKTINGANKDEAEIISKNLPNVRLALESLYYRETEINLKDDKTRGYFDFAKSIAELTN